MTMQPVVLQGITQEDIQRILQQTVDKSGKKGSGILAFDASYLYNFSPNDFVEVRKLNMLPRYKKGAVIEWHRILERWYNDQTVSEPFGRQIKPLNIVRQFDKVVNEGLEMVADCLTGGGDTLFKYHGLGDGAIEEPTAGDFKLVHEISRVDVTLNILGGSLSREGSTIYVVGNHPITLADADISETGVFDFKDATNDNMLDHSVFPSVVPHQQQEDVQGSTTIIYMCGV